MKGEIFVFLIWLGHLNFFLFKSSFYLLIFYSG